jgi:hypothetical protein
MGFRDTGLMHLEQPVSDEGPNRACQATLVDTLAARSLPHKSR